MNKNQEIKDYQEQVEQWKDIEGYEGSYQISSLGRVKSLDRYEASKSNSTRLRRGCMLKQKQSRTGYMLIGLSKESKKSHPSLHRLVAIAFIPNPENKPTVNHKDGNKKNNTVSNLEWSTHEEQMQHAFSTGLCQKRGNEIYAPSFKLRVKEHYETTGCSIQESASVFDISPRSAGRFIKFKSRSNFTLPEESVELAKRLRKEGLTLEKISKIIGCGISQVHRIVNGLSRNVQHERK